MKKYNQTMDLDSLIIDMRSKDKSFKKLFKILKRILFVFIIIYAGGLLINPDSDLTLNHRIAGVCCVISFSLFAFYLNKYLKKYNEVNYSDPVKKVLTDAEYRYRKFNTDTIIVIIGGLFCNAAIILLMIGNFWESKEKFYSFLIHEAIFLVYIALLVFLGIRYWNKKSKPIWLSAKKILKELDEG